MLSANRFERTGSNMSEKLGKLLVEQFKEDPAFKEGFNFKEDNTMSNSGDLYTTVLGKAIWYKSYDKFQKYYDMTMYYTPADLGMPEGAGAYKLPMVLGATATKPGEGEVMDYTNNNKTSVTLETETYGIATRIGRRLLKRAAKGAIEKFMNAASDAVHRAVCTDIINGIITGAAAGNTIALGVSYDNIEKAKQNVRDAVTSDSVKYGFIPDTLALTSEGWTILAQSSDYKNMVFYGQRNVPGEKTDNKYSVFNGLNVMLADLATSTKNAKVVHAIVFDSTTYMGFLMETGMETFDGRIQGTPGDVEIIHALDAGLIVMVDSAASVITTV